MTGAALLLLKLLKKRADPLLIEHFYRELMLLEPMAQLGYHVKLVVDGPKRITLLVQSPRDGVRVGG